MKKIIVVLFALVPFLFSCKKELVAKETEKIVTITVVDSTPVQWLRLLVKPADSLFDVKKITGVVIYDSKPLNSAPNQLLPGDRIKKYVYFVPLLNRPSAYGVEYTLQAATDSLKTAPGGPYRPATMAEYVGMLRDYTPYILMQAHGVACITTLQTGQAGSMISVVYGVNQAGPTKQIILNAGYAPTAPILPGNEVLAVKM